MKLARELTAKFFLTMAFVLAIGFAICTAPVATVVATEPLRAVYPGGFPIGMVLDIKGAVIDEVVSVRTAAGNASLGNKLKRGDAIVGIDGKAVSNCDEIVDLVEGGNGAEMTLKLLRDGKEMEISVTPYIESDSGLYKLGVYIRDTISGVGTVTYIKENGNFAALGHKIIDSIAGFDVPISGGDVYECEIEGVTPSKRNSPGEIRAAIKGESIGKIFSNTDYGVFGKFFSFTPHMDLVSQSNRNEVVPGKGYIIASVADSPVVYEIDIIRALPQNAPNGKGIMLRITDKRLLEKSGGIVQGMSGSPILVGGKLIGAVTHVLIGDPTKGYAVYIDWMQP